MSAKETVWPPTRPEGGCALVTGGSGAIGAATVHALVADGWPVVVHYGRGADRAQAVVAAVREAAQIFIGREPHSRMHDLLFGNTLLSLAKKTTVPVTLVP